MPESNNKKQIINHLGNDVEIIATYTGWRNSDSAEYFVRYFINDKFCHYKNIGATSIDDAILIAQSTELLDYAVFSFYNGV